MELDAQLQAAVQSDALLQKARGFRQQGSNQSAAEAYHEVLHRNPKQIEALKTLGVIYFEGGQFEKARYLLDEALRLDPSDLENLCVYGVALAQLGRREEAIMSFNRALAFDPNYIHALVNRATALQEIGRFEESLRDFALCIKLDPNHVGAINNIGTTYVAMKRFPEAVASYDRAVDLSPDFAMARDNRRKAIVQAQGAAGAPDLARYLLARGNEFLQRQAYAEALILFDEALGLDPANPEAASHREAALQAMSGLEEAGAGLAQYLCARGMHFLRQRRLTEALISFDEALKQDPNLIEAVSSRATALFEMGRAEEAISGFDSALALNDAHTISWNNRGNALASLGRHEEAITSYDRALALQPGLAQAMENRANALFALKQLDRCPPDYMRRLFDDFSSHYDETMLEKLQYRAHRHLRDLARTIPSLHAPQRILDLGSGTGLVGAAFKDMAAGGRLDGIDLSPRMNEAARQRGIYDDLILGDIEIVLNETSQIYDLILAADTMIYLGDLEKVFSGVAKRLTEGGFYLFAAEAKQGEGWEQTQSNRFRHSDRYLRETAAKAGLAAVKILPCTLRMEHGVPVAGFVVALQKAEAV